MKTHCRAGQAALLALLLSTFTAFYVAQLSTAFAQGTAFTYQGRLNDGSSPANGTYDLQFTLFSVSSGPGTVAGPITNSPTGVTNGLFTVTLDFGAGVFTGPDRWLEIGVRTNGSVAAHQSLSPRQKITATPYAMTAGNVTGSVAAGQLTGTIAPANIGAGTINSTMLATGSVTSNQLANGSVTSTSLADGAVTAQKMASVSNWFALTIANPTPAYVDRFGISGTAVGTDRVLIGANLDDTGATDAGAAYLFSTNGTLLTTFTNPTPADFDHFGSSVAAVGTDRVLIGATLDGTGATNTGAAYLFNTNGLLLTTFTNPTPADSEGFGTVAAVGTDRVLIGASGDNTGATGAGAAYLFSTNGTLLTTFTNPTPAAGDFFGGAVAAVGTDRVLIGASGDNKGATDAGAAYLFSTNGLLLTTFTNPAPADYDNFGYSVAAAGTDRVLIGTLYDDTGVGYSGAAYLYSTNGTLLTTFTNPTPAANDLFGHAVAAVGTDRVLIGAYADDTGATGAGAAYLFSTNGTLLTTFTNPTPADSDNFGYSVAAVGTDRVLIGTLYDDTGATSAGAAYLFALESYSPGVIADGVRSRSVTTVSLEDGAVTAAKIGGVLFPSQIPELDASKITTGTLADARLSTNVSLLGQSIESGEITDGTIVNADIADGTIADTKLATIATAGKVADTSLSTNVALLNTNQTFAGTNTFSKVIKSTLNAGASTPVNIGDRFRDNAIVAWARVNNGAIVGNTFGVTSLTSNAVGNYTITLNSTFSSQANVIPMAIAEADNPPTNAASARVLTVDQIGTTQFRVFINNGNWSLTNNDFLFIVTGR